MKKYDEAFFRAKTNKRAKIAWLVLVIVACVYYAIKVYTGKIAFGYATIVAVTGWVSYIAGFIILKLKGNDYAGYKWIVGLLYMLFQFDSMDSTRSGIICIYPAIDINIDTL